jgi:predicted metal-dependent hydrolase
MVGVPRLNRQLSLFSEQEKPGDPPGFSVRKSLRAKRMSIKVYPRGAVEVVVPRRTRARDVETFVADHLDWITRCRESFAEIVPPESFMLPQAIELPAIGRRIRVRYVPKPGATGVGFRSTEHEVVISGKVGDDGLCIMALKRWLATVAKREFRPRLEALSATTGIAYQAMHVRGQKTCWGSRSSRGTISLNYCLLFLSPELLRYLMIHELCHARHMNHSQRFWRLVRRYEPDCRRLDRRLGASWKDVPGWIGMY